MTRRKVTLSLNPDQFAELEALMKEDGQTNFTFFAVYLISREKKFRENEKMKRAGRPKNESKDEPIVWYKAPDGSRTPYSKDDLESYYAFRNMDMPDITTFELYEGDL